MASSAAPVLLGTSLQKRDLRAEARAHERRLLLPTTPFEPWHSTHAVDTGTLLRAVGAAQTKGSCYERDAGLAAFPGASIPPFDALMAQFLADVLERHGAEANSSAPHEGSGDDGSDSAQDDRGVAPQLLALDAQALLAQQPRPREVPLLSRPTARLEAASPAKLTSCTRNTSAADSGHQREVAAARRQIFLLDWVQPIVETEPRTRIGALAECMAAERAAARPGPDARLFAGIEAPIAWPTSPRGAMAFTAVECSAQRLGRGFAKLEEKGGADDDAEPGPSLCTLTQRADWAEHFQQWLARPLDVRARKSCTAHISQLERRRSVPPRVLEVDASLPIAARALTAHELCLHGGFCDAARRDVAVEARPEGTLALGITGIGSRELEAHWRSRVSDARTQ